MWHSLLVFFGIDDEAGPGYGFFSGVGSDLGEIAIIGAVLGAYHRHNCHTVKCWRIARHTVVDHDGTTYPACRKHRQQIVAKVRTRQ